MLPPASDALRRHDIRPSAHRLAIADFVLHTRSHPSADDVFTTVREDFPIVSRATVYNTLNLFVRKGLLRRLAVSEGRIVYDPDLSPHHHLVDEDTGEVHDIPWDALPVPRIESIEGFDVTEYQVVLRGRKRTTGESE
jgi:Fe2+ or Zn2+ uptake regulation protein